ncbi:DUF6355 family natural product biosynthesis protein [Saccharothrix xinjiangensis]|uniref:DUF6355 family natural product biosynthesis protein n=1 Tax=Saccharothrix xinjiangensis TaxID=204798 RepID=A0ABV9Y9H3_9PSEU
MIITFLQKTGVRRALVTTVTVLAGFLDPLPPQASAQPSPAPRSCGFQHVDTNQHGGASALYVHCTAAFILIQVDTAQGGHHRCVEPWGTVRFYPREHINNAYYVQTLPRLLTASDGSRICALSQPPV